MSALVLEDEEISSMSVLLPIWPDLDCGPGRQPRVGRHFEKGSHALEKIHVSPQIECFYF